MSSAELRSDVLPGDVEDPLDPAHGTAHLPPVEDVTLGELHVETDQVVAQRPRPHRHPYPIAALDEQARDVRADEPGRSRNQGDHRSIVSAVWG